MASLKSRTKASVLIQKYIAIGRNKEKEDSEEQHADIAYMVRTKDYSEVVTSPQMQSQTLTKKMRYYLSLSFHKLKAYLLEMMKEYNTFLIKHNTLKISCS